MANAKMFWPIVVAIVVALFIVFAGGLGVATNPNKRYPENAKADEHLWVVLVVIGLALAPFLL